MNKEHKDYLVCSVNKVHAPDEKRITSFAEPKTLIIPKDRIVSIFGDDMICMLTDSSGAVWRTQTGINEILDRYDESRLELTPETEGKTTTPPTSIREFYVVGTQDEIRSGRTMSTQIFKTFPTRSQMYNLLTIKETTFLAKIKEYPHLFSGELLARWDIDKADWAYFLERERFTVNHR